MKTILLVALGGSIGTVARLGISSWMFHHYSQWRFPIGTAIVNWSGCLIIGLISGLIEKHHGVDYPWRTFWLTGVLGGFTTFSAFSFETISLLKRGEMGIAITYVATSVIFGLLATWGGIKAGLAL